MQLRHSVHEVAFARSMLGEHQLQRQVVLTAPALRLSV
jgi:hypothetical protein